MLIHSIVKNYTVTKEQYELVQKMRKSNSELEKIYNEVISNTELIIEKLKSIYIEHSLDINDYEKEKNVILNLSKMYFCFQVLFYAVNNAGQKLKQNKNTILNLELIVENLDKHIEKLNEEIDNTKKSFGDKEKQATTEIQDKYRKAREDLKKLEIVPPSSYGKMKSNSLIDFTSNLVECFEDIEIPKGGYISKFNNSIELNGKVINTLKEQKGLRKIDKPRGINDNDKIVINKK